MARLVLKRTVVGDWHLDILNGGHLQSQGALFMSAWVVEKSVTTSPFQRLPLPLIIWLNFQLCLVNYIFALIRIALLTAIIKLNALKQLPMRERTYIWEDISNQITQCTLNFWPIISRPTVFLKVFQHHWKTWIVRFFFRCKAGKSSRWNTFRNWRRRRRYNHVKYITTWRSSYHLKRQHGGTVMRQWTCHEL